jgi:hypothetical protein
MSVEGLHEFGERAEHRAIQWLAPSGSTPALHPLYTRLGFVQRDSQLDRYQPTQP